MFASILVCSDGSEHALRAAQAAAEIASKFQASVTLLSVFHITTTLAAVSGAPEAGAYIDDETMQRLCDDFHLSIQHNTGRVFEDMGVRYCSRCECGLPVDTILAVAESLKADLIVMGSRGLGGFKRMLLGSVSDSVVHHASCPVLIVR